jgi:hypothetical protein
MGSGFCRGTARIFSKRVEAPRKFAYRLIFRLFKNYQIFTDHPGVFRIEEYLFHMPLIFLMFDVFNFLCLILIFLKNPREVTNACLPHHHHHPYQQVPW